MTSAAFAGEIGGPGSPTGVPASSNPTPTAAPAHANSICAYDKSYGQLVRAGAKDFIPSPGEACNGSTSGLKH